MSTHKQQYQIDIPELLLKDSYERQSTPFNARDIEWHQVANKSVQLLTLER